MHKYVAPFTFLVLLVRSFFDAGNATRVRRILRWRHFFPPKSNCGTCFFGAFLCCTARRMYRFSRRKWLRENDLPALFVRPTKIIGRRNPPRWSTAVPHLTPTILSPRANYFPMSLRRAKSAANCGIHINRAAAIAFSENEADTETRSHGRIT